jgi:deoxynucleoside triphosphate triphosphohydrolase SAMHD1
MTSPFPGRVKHFIETLNRDYPSFNAQLNTFFDAIGFTKDFPPVFQRGPLLRSHAVKDNVWGMIEFDEPIRRLVDSPLVQRLRGIRQTGLTHLTYPTATHTRFAHTLGVYATTTRLLTEINRTHGLHRERHGGSPLHATPLNGNTTEILKRAAILHDVGHGPYSHVSERLFSPNTSGLFLEAYLWMTCYAVLDWSISASASQAARDRLVGNH